MEVGFMPNLTYVDATNNHFQGSLPDFFGVVDQLQVMRLGNNDIAGTISPSIRELSNLRELDLSGNTNLRGRIPEELGQLTALERVDLTRTRLTGPIPNEVCEKESMGLLELLLDDCASDDIECCPTL